MIRKLDNTKAFYLIENCDMPEKTKRFLISHLTALSDLAESLSQDVQSRECDILHLKDVIEKNNALNDAVIKVKEKLISIDDNEIQEQLGKILKFIGTYFG